MHILITRPEADAQPLKQEIEALGCRVSLAPLITIVPNGLHPSDIAGATALVATSRNALRALNASPALELARSLPLYVVGPGTAAAAKEMGFGEIVEGGGTAESLVPLIEGRSSGQSIVHFAGDVLAFDLEGALAAKHIDLRRVTAYRSVAATKLAPEIVAALVNHDIDAVLLMSPRSAATWAELAGKSLPAADLEGISYMCLSDAVAKALKRRLGAARTIIADEPNVTAMRALVKRLAAPEKGE